GLGCVEPHRRRHDPFKLCIGHLLGLARRQRTLGSFDEIRAEPTELDWCGNGHQESPGRAASTSFAVGRWRVTSRLNSRAALSPKMLRLACSERKGRVVIALGGSKSQCGQSEA